MTDNQLLRQLLWIRHGCPFPALYGDDGEMQCGNCRIDFKRDSAKTIQRRFREISQPKIAAAMLELVNKIDLRTIKEKEVDEMNKTKKEK